MPLKTTLISDSQSVGHKKKTQINFRNGSRREKSLGTTVLDRSVHFSCVGSEATYQLHGLLAIGFISIENAFRKLETVSNINQALFSFCLNGNKFQVQRLVLLNIDVNCTDAIGNTPLMICAMNRFCDIARVLLEKGADVNITNRHGNSALMLSVAYSCSTDMIRTLLEQKTINIHQKNSDGYTCLMMAMEMINFDIVKLILGKAFGENNPTMYKKSIFDAHLIAIRLGVQKVFLYLEKEISTHEPAMFSAVLEGDLCSARFMVDYGVAKNDSSGSLIIRTLQFYEQRRAGVNEIDFEIMKTLLKKDENATFSCQDGRKVLAHCVNIRNVHLLDLLCFFLSKRYNMFSEEMEEIFYLALLAVFNECRGDLLSVLVRYNPRLLYSNTVRSPIEKAIITGAFDFIDMFLNLGGTIDVKESLFTVIKHEKFDSFLFILTRFRTDALNIVTENTNGVLHRAAEKRNIKIIETLIDFGADVNVIYKEKTPLMWCKDFTVAKRLIELGADVNKTAGNNLSTPFLNLFSLEYMDNFLQQSNVFIKGFKFAEKMSEIVRDMFTRPVTNLVNLFLEKGARINDRNLKGKTAVMLASTDENFQELLKHLLDSGADPNIGDNRGQTALHLAVREKCELNVLALLNYKADIHSKETEGNSCLHLCVKENNLPMLNMLIEHGADVNAENNVGDTPLIVAAENRQTKKEIINHLLDSDANMNHRNNYGYTALMKAASSYFPELIQILCDRGADVNIRNNDNGQNVVSIMTEKCAHAGFVTEEYSQCLYSVLERGGSAECLKPEDVFKLIDRRLMQLIQKLIRAGFSPSECILDETRFLRHTPLMNPVSSTFSPFVFAILRNRIELAEYFTEINFLTDCDIFHRDRVRSIRLHLERSNREKSLEFLNEFYWRPLSLQKICLVTISSAIGPGLERVDKMNTLPLPTKLKDVLLFKQDEVTAIVLRDAFHSVMGRIYFYDSDDSDDYEFYDVSDDN
ncbi:hypothetical protein Btru_022174 [Bulinus truncatus]|nr:hypothetical protein Btru_022174 [Bulinus truncatus]